MARPMKPPSSAPATPSSIVTMKPPGSRPGVKTFAIIPTTSPNTIHDRIPMSVLLAHRAWSAIGSPGQTVREDAFVAEQPPLAVESAAVARQRPVGADDAMAGHDDGDRIRAVRRPDGPHRRGLSNPLRQLGIRDGRAGRNAP